MIRQPGEMVRWIAAAGAFVMSLDSMVNVAFPSIATAFRLDPEDVRWIIVCYVLTYAVMAFAGGALADRVGHGVVFRAGLALSTLGFLVAGLAGSFGWLLAGRVIQGFAGGLVYGTAPGLTTLAVPAVARGRALGFLGGAIALAFAIGPLAAGFLIEAFGWRAVFHVRVPLALLALAWSVALRPPALAGAAARFVTLADVLRRPVLAASALSFVANAAIFAVGLLAPFYLVGTRALDTRTAGALFMLSALGMAVASPLAGRLADRIGPRLPLAAGLALEALGLAALSRAGATTPIVVLGVALFGAGFGLGLFQVPNVARVMAAFPAGQQGAAGGLTFLSRTLGIVTGVATLSAVFAYRRERVGPDAAFAEAFLLAAVVVAVAAAITALRASTPRHGP